LYKVPITLRPYQALIGIALAHTTLVGSILLAFIPMLILGPVFTSPSILSHYVELYTCTIAIAMLEKLLSARSFGGFINHLTCHQTTLLFLWVAWPPFCGLDCCPCIIGVLGIDRSSTCHSFLTG